MNLVLEDVVKAYGKKSVLDHASYTFEEGKIYVKKERFMHCLAEMVQARQPCSTVSMRIQTMRERLSWIMGKR